jgi:minor extracellular serine protease Vpr
VATGTGQVILSSPGIFLTDFFSLDRPGAVLTETNQLTDSTVRAKRNEVIQIFATGAGPLTQPVADGAPAPVSPLAQTILAPRVFIGNEEATVEFSGLAPGYVGLWQVNAWVPDVDTITGQVPVVIVAPGGSTSNAVTIWVE